MMITEIKSEITQINFQRDNLQSEVTSCKSQVKPGACGLRPAARKGVTLIELIMVITVMGILTAVSSMYIKETIDLWRFLTFRSEVTAQVRTALLRMGREIRQIRDDLSVNTANVSQFQFVDINNAAIDYQLSGNNLLRNADILASGVSGLSFTYYDADNQALTVPKVSPDNTDIRRINISLTMESGTESKTLNLQLYPRNL